MIKKNELHVLGDVVAEVDHRMLDHAFLETPDYQALRTSAEKAIVVGRRGTGKSALFYRLSKDWTKDSKTALITIAPEDYEMIGLRGYLRDFGGGKPNLLRAGSKIFWRYALIMEVAQRLSEHYRWPNDDENKALRHHLTNWRKGDGSMFERLHSALSEAGLIGEPPERMVRELAKALQVESLQKELASSISATRLHVRVLIDRIDEGYEASERATNLIGGLLLAATTLNLAFRNGGLEIFIFLRDNIARAIAETDPDYTRNLENRIIRLHWDEQSLLYMICKRLRIAFDYNQENDLKVWNKFAAQSLRKREGFRRCLRLTLYRPRDLLVLLNQAFYNSRFRGLEHIDDQSIERSAKEISNNRRRDLVKEYEGIVIGLDRYVTAFAGSGSAAISFGDSVKLIANLQSQLSPEEKQHYEIVGGAAEIVKALYSVGFLGARGGQGTSYVFSHDGKPAMKTFTDQTEMLVHPCYWMSLGLRDMFFEDAEAEEIHDDEDDLGIEIMTDSTTERNQKIGQILAEYNEIPEGTDGASRFEKWCEKVVRILFAGGLENVELHPNGAATQRRDVVARNTEGTEFWKRLRTDYQVRQVIFEVKNVSRELKSDEFRQLAAYLKHDYGRLGFIISRSTTLELKKGKELNWVKEIWDGDPKKIIIKLTGKMLCDLLSKQRSPQKFRLTDKRMGKILDQYSRLYFGVGR